MAAVSAFIVPSPAPVDGLTTPRGRRSDGPAAVRELAAGQEVEPLFDCPIGALGGSMLSCYIVPLAREALFERRGGRFHQGGVEGRSPGGAV